MTALRVPQCTRCLGEVRSLALAVFALLALTGWGAPSTPCGVFTFAGSPIATAGINCQVFFSDFDTATCGAVTCTCSTIAYVQIIRVIDLNNGEFRQPHSDQEKRMVLGNATKAFNGWAVDRLKDFVWGYYGREDDGSFDSKLTTGSNTAPAILRDKPRGWAVNNRFDAVSVPVCIASGSTCENKLLGYEHWRFTVKSDGSYSDLSSEIGGECHGDAFDLAVKEWNTDASDLGQKVLPAMSRAHRAPADGGACEDETLPVDLTSKRDRYQAELKRLDTEQLINVLARDSREGVEPFNSSAYRETLARGEAGAGAGATARAKAEALQQALTRRLLEEARPSADGLLALLALRSLNTTLYQELGANRRVNLLSEALANSETFNSWGIPHLFWEDAANAIIDEQTDAELALLALLDNYHDALVWGSEGVLEQGRYQYRVRDYAWVLLNEIRGEKVEIPTDPTARDALIDGFIEEMRQRGQVR